MIIRISFIVFLTVLTQALASECPVGKTIFLPNSCPRIYDESDKSYCCLNTDYETYRCCDLSDYAKQQGMGVLLIICILVPIIAVIICCVCCICCPFCLIYKRRHRGVVYGRTPGQVIQNPGPTTTAQPSSYPAYPSYPPQQQTMAIPTPYAPPPYPAYPQPPSGAAPPYSATTTQELYPRQAPYNPSYN